MPKAAWHFATAACDSASKKTAPSPVRETITPVTDRSQTIVSGSAGVPIPAQDDTIESVVPASRAQWLDYCNTCPGVTFFHTPFWADLFERCFPRRYKAVPLLFRFHDGSSALLPLIVKRHMAGLIRIGCSMPAGTYGGWLSHSSPLRQQQEIAIMDHCTGNADLVFRENPYSPVQLPPEKFRSREDHTQTINLSAGYGSVWLRSTAAHRNAVRNAQRSGLEVREAQSSSEWEEYCTIYDASIDRWRKRHNFTGAKYDRPFFSEIERMKPAQRKLWLAKVGGTCIAGILCFYWKDHAVVWHGAGLSEYFSYHPNNYLYDRAIAHAADAGYAWFDCNPSGGLPGVDNFKRYLGAQPLRSRVFIERTKLTRFVSMLRQSSRRHGISALVIGRELHDSTE